MRTVKIIFSTLCQKKKYQIVIDIYLIYIFKDIASPYVHNNVILIWCPKSRAIATFMHVESLQKAH